MLRYYTLSTTPPQYNNNNDTVIKKVFSNEIKICNNIELAKLLFIIICDWDDDWNDYYIDNKLEIASSIKRQYN